MSVHCENCGTCHRGSGGVRLRLRGRFVEFLSSDCLHEWLEKLEAGTVTLTPRPLADPKAGRPCDNCARVRDGRWRHTYATSAEGQQVLVRICVRVRGQVYEFCCENCLDEWLEKEGWQ